VYKPYKHYQAQPHTDEFLKSFHICLGKLNLAKKQQHFRLSHRPYGVSMAVLLLNQLCFYGHFYDTKIITMAIKIPLNQQNEPLSFFLGSDEVINTANI